MLLQRPAFPELRRQHLRGLAAVGEAHGLGVPLEFLAREVHGDDAQQSDLGQRAAVGEVGTGLAAVADGIQPVLVMLIVDARQLLRRCGDRTVSL